MSRIFQILHNHCHWLTPFGSLEETVGKFPPDCLFVEAPDYVNEQWGFDETEIGDARFIKPVAPEGFVYDDETGQIVAKTMIPVLLEETKNAKQAENNMNLASYLSSHPMTWTDGKEYGVTLEDQNEIAMNLLSYEMAAQVAMSAADESGSEAVMPVLEWHARHEACVAWAYEDLVALSMAIRQYVYPWYQKNQEYKAQIFACETAKAVKEINPVYINPDDPPKPDPMNPQDPLWNEVNNSENTGETDNNPTEDTTEGNSTNEEA